MQIVEESKQKLFCVHMRVEKTCKEDGGKHDVENQC